MEFLDTERIVSSLIDLMGAYRWIVVGAVTCTSAILLGFAAPIAQRLEDAYGTLVVQTTYRYL
jgi:hypothetical protein